MGTRFRVISFNIRHYWADDGPNSWEHRSGAVRRLLADHRADIICLQEVNRELFDFFDQALPGYECVSDRLDRGPRWEYRPVFIKPPFKILEQETISLSETPETPSKSWGSNFIRQATRAVLEVLGQELTVYNTHLDFQEPVQRHQAGVIRDQILARDSHRPVVLVGDFNSTEDQQAYSLLAREPAREAGPALFSDAMTRPAGPSYHGFGQKDGRGIIDWILYRGPGLALAEPARTIRDRPGGRYPSDHYPVTAGFELVRGERKKDQ